MPERARLAAETRSGDLRVAVEPIADAERQKRHFGVVFDRARLLPVYAVVENLSSEASVLVRPELATLALDEADCPDVVPLAEPSQRPYRREMDVADSQTLSDEVGGAIAVAAVPLLAIPLLFGGEVLSEQAVQLRHRLLLDGLHAATLEPGESVRGILVLSRPEGAVDFCLQAVDLGVRAPRIVRVELESGAP